MFRRPFFPLPPQERTFEKGGLKYIILDLIKEKPSHGYEIIRTMEEYFHGFYSPSAGSIYPTLQMLEDMGYVDSLERDGKKVYSITAAGKEFLRERRDVVAKIKSQMKDHLGTHKHEEFHSTMHELESLWRLIGHRPSRSDADKWVRIRNVITRARREIEDIFNG